MSESRRLAYVFMGISIGLLTGLLITALALM